MKKLLIITLILALVFCLSACGDSGSNVNGNETENNNITENVEDTAKENEVVDINKKITVEMVENAPVTDGSFFKVVEVEGGVSIDAYTGTDEIVVIPEKIDGKTVVEIEDGAFVNAETIKGIKLADTIKILGDSAFVNSECIEIIVAGVGLKTIEQYAISCCPNLREVKLNDGLEFIGAGGIAIVPSLKEVYIPASVTEMYFSIEKESLVICEEGSAAEEYAKTNGFNYKIK